MKVQTQEGLIGNITVIGVAIASVFIILLSSGVFTMWSALVGAICLLLLLAYSQHGETTQTRIEHLVSSSAFALSSLLILGWLLYPLYQQLDLTRYYMSMSRPFIITFSWALISCVLWLIATLIWMRIHPRQRWPEFFQTVTAH